jgi:UDP-glucose 4-epimerase
MKILVTGGAGFIGSHIVDRYVSEEHQVLVVDDLSTGSKENINKKATLIKIDIRSLSLKSLILREKPEVINHHAAQINLRQSVENPIKDADINIMGLLNLMESASKAKSVKKIIFASTGGAIYGDAGITPTPEEYPAWPISPYGVAKLTSEHYLHFYQEVYEIPFVSLRYGNVYGPRQNPHGEAGVIAIFADKMLKGIQPTINGKGKQTRDFVFVEDVVRANSRVLQSGIKGIFNIATGIETDINTIYYKLAINAKYPKKANHGPVMAGEQKTSVLDCSKARREFSWKAEIKIDEGLKRTVKFFKDK